MRVTKSALLASALAFAPSVFADETAALDRADNGFILMSAMLVLLMSIPGIGLFYGGLTRSKNVLSTMEQCLAVFCMAIILWVIIGYSFAFGPVEGVLGDFFGGFGTMFLAGIDFNSLSGTLAEYTWVIFQGAFCAISACLIVGATVERVKFSAILIAVGI